MARVASLYERLARPALFRLDPERAHAAAAWALRMAHRLPGGRAWLRRTYRFEHPALAVRVAGLSFPNPVGVAAGFDKDCGLAGWLPSLGFGFVETGTITPRPQGGNPAPRLFRVPERQALINRMGFNNCGAAAAARRLGALGGREGPVGVNIGMNADTAPERAHEDYAECYRLLAPYADYFVVNVSSPNTPGLRQLQDRLRLERILTAVRAEAVRDPETHKPLARRPVFVKLSPDLDHDALVSLIPVLLQESDGVVASNTTLARDGVPEAYSFLRGGLSGPPLRDRSTELVAAVSRLTNGRLPIIGVGGISGPDDAYQKIRAGASLVQVYTGLVYRGPGLAREINEGLVWILREHGLRSITQAVGLSRSVPTAAMPGPA